VICQKTLDSPFQAFGITVRAFAKPGAFDRNASANPNITQNRNLSNVLRNPGFANALLASGQIFLEDYLIDDEFMKSFLPLIPKIVYTNNN
jgi:hypothetical protein